MFFYAISGVVLALTMVTNIPYRSFKKLDIKGIKPFKLLVAIVILMSFVAYEPELFGFIFSRLRAKWPYRVAARKN